MFFRNKPKIKVQIAKPDGFSGWIKCSGCEEMIHATELEHNLNCCPKCSYHYRLSLFDRLSLLADEGSPQELFTHIKPIDSLCFRDTSAYKDRLAEAQKKTGRDDAIWVGGCTIQDKPAALCILDFSFMGGSMGSVVGERLTCLIEWAVSQKKPLLIVSASGGARMQESILSLMQMAKTSAALARLHAVGLPYISILTNPTTGGVTASFATLGDVILAEPDALIAFAGPRVVEQTIKQKLPPKAQKSEFILERGLIDCIVKRRELKGKVAFFIEFLMNNEQVAQQMRERLRELLELSQDSLNLKKL